MMLLTSRKLTYPTFRKENHLQKCIGMGYVSSQESIFVGCLMNHIPGIDSVDG